MTCNILALEVVVDNLPHQVSRQARSYAFRLYLNGDCIHDGGVYATAGAAKKAAGQSMLRILALLLKGEASAPKNPRETVRRSATAPARKIATHPYKDLQ